MGKRKKRTPEEKAESEAFRQRVVERIQFHRQRLENERAAREGRRPRDIPLELPSDEEVKRMLRERIVYYERRMREQTDG